MAKNLSDVSKFFRDASSNDVIAATAFHHFLEDQGIIDIAGKDDPLGISDKLSQFTPTNYDAYHMHALEKYNASIVNGSAKGLNDLIELGKLFGSEEAKIASENFISKFGRRTLERLIGYRVYSWCSAIILNGIGAGFGLIVVYVIATILESFGIATINISIGGNSQAE